MVSRNCPCIFRFATLAALIVTVCTPNFLLADTPFPFFKRGMPGVQQPVRPGTVQSGQYVQPGQSISAMVSTQQQVMNGDQIAQANGTAPPSAQGANQPRPLVVAQSPVPSMTTHGFSVQPQQVAMASMGNQTPIQRPVGFAQHGGPAPMQRVPVQGMQRSPMQPVPVQGVSIETARQMERVGNLAAADAHYRTLLSQAPRDRNLLISYGRMKHRANDLPGAVQVYQQALQWFPNDPVILNDLGLCFARMNDLPNAVAALRASIGVRPDSQRYRNNLAIVLLEMNRVEEAHAVLAEVHGDMLAKYNLAVILQRRGNLAEAKQLLASVVEVNPAFAPAKTLLAQIDTPSERVAALPKSNDVPAEAPSPGTDASAQRPLSLIAPQSAVMPLETSQEAQAAVFNYPETSAPDVEAFHIPGVGLDN